MKENEHSKQKIPFNGTDQRIIINILEQESANFGGTMQVHSRFVKKCNILYPFF